MVSSYLMIYPIVQPKLLTQYSKPLGHENHSSIAKNGQKSLKTRFLPFLVPQPPILPITMLYGLMNGV
jgi:hypothetical protein